MADMFGAPVGIAHAQEEQQRNLLAGTSALKTLGEIDQQPAEKLMKLAQADYYGSLAKEHAAKAADLEAMQRLDANIAAARAGGVDLTVADADAASKPPVAHSAAEPFEEFVRMGQDAGAPLRLLEKAATTGVTIRQHEAATESSQATAARQQALMVKDHATRMGALASWGLQGPAAYDQMLAQAMQEGLDTSHLPPSFGPEAQAALRGIQEASMTTKDKAELAIKQASEKAQEKRTQASMAKAAAYVKVAGANYDLRRQEYLDRSKNDGDRSPSAAAARQAMIQRREELSRAQDLEKFPPIKLDQSAIVAGQNYTARDGRKVQAVEDPNGDITGFKGKKLRLVVVGPARVPLVKDPASRGQPPNDEPPDDDEDD